MKKVLGNMDIIFSFQVILFVLFDDIGYKNLQTVVFKGDNFISAKGHLNLSDDNALTSVTISSSSFTSSSITFSSIHFLSIVM